MSDERLRRLERERNAGVPGAWKRLKEERRRRWRCVGCGGNPEPPPRPKLRRRIARRVIRWALKIEEEPPVPRCKVCLAFSQIDLAETMMRTMYQISAQSEFQQVHVPGRPGLLPHAGVLEAIRIMEHYELPEWRAPEDSSQSSEE